MPGTTRTARARETLAELVHRRPSVDEALWVAMAVSAGLHDRHVRARGHGTLNPDGVELVSGKALIRPAGAHRAAARNLAYRPPEWFLEREAPPTVRGDLYSLGVMLYELFTGRLPFHGQDVLGWQHAHLALQPPPVRSVQPAVPDALAAIVERLLAKHPDDRYATAAEVLRDLTESVALLGPGSAAAGSSARARHAGGLPMPSGRVCGRDAERQALEAALDAARQHPRPLVITMVGEAGVGKTALVEELITMIRGRGGLVGGGKFEQRFRELPYGTLSATLAMVVDGVQAGAVAPDTARPRLIEALGQSAGLVTAAAPPLERLIGPQPPVVGGSGEDARLRFLETMWRLVAALAGLAPLFGLIFDDLQWADPASIEMFGKLVAESGIPGLVLVLVHRTASEGGAEAEEPAESIVRQACPGTGTVRLRVEPLDLDGTGELVADALGVTVDEVGELVRAVHASSGGNPFDSIRTLWELHAEGALSYQRIRRAWAWDLRRFITEPATDENDSTGRHLTATQLARLPRDSKRVLEVASCVRGVAPLAMLSQVSGLSPERALTALGPAVEANLVSTDGQTVTFAHDTIRNEAYRLPSGRRRTGIRLGIARVLRDGSATTDDRVFDVVEQFSAARYRPHRRTERLEVLRIYLEAARRARGSGAFAAAVRYLDEALSRFTVGDWRTARDLAVEVHQARAEVALALHDFPQAAEFAQLALRHSRTPTQRAAATRIVAETYFTQGRVADAVAVGLEAAAAQRLVIPPHPGPEAAAEAYWAVHHRLLAMAEEQLLALPVCRDEDALAAIRVLHSFAAVAGFFDRDLQVLVNATVVRLSLDHGLAAETSHALAWVAMIAAGRYGQYQAADRLARATYRLTERPLWATDRVMASWYLALILRWTCPPGAELEYLDGAFDLARATGNPPMACYVTAWETRLLFDTDRPLEEVAACIEEAARYVDRTGFPVMSGELRSQRWFVARLRGEQPLLGGHDEEADRIADSQEQLPFWLFLHEMLRLQLLVIEGDHHEALTAAERASALGQHDSGLVETANLVFYRALAAVGAAGTASQEVRSQLAEDGVAQLARWAETGPERFGCRAALLRAEYARLQGDELTALHAFQDAADAAGGSRQLGVQALVAERCAAFHAAAGRVVDAEAHLRSARAAYRRWGAQGRVRVLDGKLATAQPDLASGEDSATLAVVRTAQGISEATTVDELVDRLMRTVLQVSGGDYAALLLIPDGGALELAAEAGVRRREPGLHVVYHPRGTAAAAASLPAGVLQAALAAGEPVQLDGAAVPDSARSGPGLTRAAPRSGLTRAAPRSVLCLPMFLQRRLRGLLYVENRLLVGAFPARHRDLLEVLASQAAVSIENTRAREQLAASEQRYRILVEAAPDAIITTDPNGEIVLVNSQTERLFGYSRDELLGRRIDFLIDHYQGLHSDGDRFPVETTHSSAQTASGRLDTVIVRDISERRRFEEQLQYLADHDTLTGLYNRRRLESELEQEVTRSRRYHSPSALLLVDLDNFKDINDVLGHHAGDEVLRAAAQALRHRTRDCDIVARLGGDEFALLLPETSVDQAAFLAQDLLRALAAVRVVLANRQTAVTASIGVAGVTDVGGTAADVLAAADVALYEAKESGRNRVAVYDVRRLSAIRSRLSWCERLREALDDDGFVLHGQPILDLRSYTVTRYELLIRMRTDDPAVVVPPDRFLPIAERNGLITHIDRWVLDRTVHLMATGALDQMSISVNLSAPSLTDPALPGYLARLLADRRGLDPRRLILEITETARITDLSEAARLARQLRDLGCGLALDDFGAGFGSFYYLKHLPLTVVKLDGDFVRALRHSPVDRLVIDTMVNIARELKLQTVAEYVQDEDTCRWLAEHGVDYAQGYWIGRPAEIGRVLPR